MTKLLQCLRDELVRRDYATPTIRSYVQIVEAFRQHTGARLDRITPAQLRRYHLYLLEERRLAVGTVVTQICALRFFFRYAQRQCSSARARSRLEPGSLMCGYWAASTALTQVFRRRLPRSLEM